MRIQRVRIQGYRCLRDVDIRFDDITTFIGPNGVGKSSVLRALDWFFNGDRNSPITSDDVSTGADPERITVEVEFCDLTDVDRVALGKYAAGGVETVRLWRRWERGYDKLSGRALAYPAFIKVRDVQGAKARRDCYNELRTERPDLGLPAVRSAAEVDTALIAWETAHPRELQGTEIEADTHFFGFAGQAKMTGLFDYVFVSADLRAGDESRDIKSSIIGRILEQAVDRTEADKELTELGIIFNANRETIHTKHFSEQLETLSDDLTTAVGELTSGRSINVSPVVPEFKMPQVQFKVSILDGRATTRVDQQGHGFQRALLISALRLLAESKATEHDRTIFLAIEEPELFQHPIQARAFATVLRKIARKDGHGVQVSYATHSPYFLEPEGFTEIRRMTRTLSDSVGASVQIQSTSKEAIAQRLNSAFKTDEVYRQLTRVCLQSLPEALFARAALLVEGGTDQGFFEGCGLRHDPLNRNGIVVVDAGSKRILPLAHAVLAELGVPCFVIFDGDAGGEHRDRSKNKAPDKIADGVRQRMQANRMLLGYLKGHVEDFPQTKVYDDYAVFHDTLETYLEAEWPDWGEAHQDLIANDNGMDGKHPMTYRHASQNANTDPPAWISDVITRAMTLCAEG
ncbi:ATP-dependent endonuclease [Streptosporangium canum]|uniref:ATP-dependent nuclease n=1 Tax=Streptosporangium canum TaxID=324952 RepID=UPI0034135968